MRRVLATAVIVLAGCNAPGGPGNGDVELTVYAAASLGDAIDEAAGAYESVGPAQLAVSTDASTALRAKIEQGAPADVFLSADMADPQALVDAGIARGRVVPFASNRLTVIVPADNPARIVSAADLARPGVRVIAAGDDVPITRYALEAIDNLARLEGYPANFAGGYTMNIVSREDNVRAVVAKVALGEGDAGVVYITDALGSADIASVEIPDVANVVASYGGVAVGTSAHPEAAAAFLAWLSGAYGQAILQRHGFGAVDPG